jgi:hypothetical protein
MGFGADVGEWMGPCDLERSVMVVELGHVADVLGRMRRRRWLSKLRSGFALWCPGVGYFHAIETDTFVSSSVLYAHGSRIFSKSSLYSICGVEFRRCPLSSWGKSKRATYPGPPVSSFYYSDTPWT